ncbi:MAG: InlB B-repeat-containing protein, partial [Synergistaceae bacterium]|nr:InlB B-repeat-containing protein [Synergistaceae bacterium]
MPGSTDHVSLIIYAQSRGESAGKLTITANNSNAHINLYNGSITINGGNVNISSTGTSSNACISSTGITINDGTISLSSTGSHDVYIQSLGNITINGGQITVNGNTAESGIKWASIGSIALGYKKQDDFITAAHYLQASSPAAPKIAEGKAFAVMTGDDFTTLVKIIDSSTALTASELDGKKLVPALTVTFNANGGTGDTYTQKVRYNTATALTANAFTRTGYTFNGWNTKQDGSGTPYADKATITLTENVTLYAQWQQQETTPPAATLSAIEVSVTGESTLTTTEGTSATSAYTASVTGKYSDGTSKTLSASDYSIAWTLDKDISGISINNGTLSVNDSVSAGTYALTITANATQDSVTGSGTRSVNITVNERQQEETPPSVTLSALEVSVTGALTITTTEGTAATSAYTATVTGKYSDGTSTTLTDCSIEWTLDKNISGIQISNNGTLSVNNSLKAGTYALTITAKAA